MKDSRILKDHSIVVEGQKIIAIVPSKDLKIPEGAKLIDLKGKYIMPGLIDMHTHIFADQELILYLANGVTSVRLLWGTEDALEWREKPFRKSSKSQRKFCCNGLRTLANS